MLFFTTLQRAIEVDIVPESHTMMFPKHSELHRYEVGTVFCSKLYPKSCVWIVLHVVNREPHGVQMIVFSVNSQKTQTFVISYKSSEFYVVIT